jgi:hypothetical protein
MPQTALLLARLSKHYRVGPLPFLFSDPIQCEYEFQQKSGVPIDLSQG